MLLYDYRRRDPPTPIPDPLPHPHVYVRLRPPVSPGLKMPQQTLYNTLYFDRRRSENGSERGMLRVPPGGKSQQRDRG